MEDEMVGWPHKHDGHEFEQPWEIVKDKEARRVAVYGVAESWTRLKQLSSSSSSRQHIKKQRHYFANKSLSSQSYGFCSSHVSM